VGRVFPPIDERDADGCGAMDHVGIGEDEAIPASG